MKPFEELFFEVGAEIMKNVSGWLAANPDATVQRVKKQLDSAIKNVRSGGDLKKMNRLVAQLKKIKAIGGFKTIIPSEVFSRSSIIVEPVVVKPDTDSKKALVIPVTFDESRKGIEEKIDKTIQLNVTRRNALLVFNSLLFPLDTRKNINPTKLVIIELITKLSQPELS